MRTIRRSAAAAGRCAEALLKYGAREVSAWQRADGEPGAVWLMVAGRECAHLGQRLGAVETPDIDQSLTVTLVERERLDDPARGDTRETWRLASRWSARTRSSGLR